MSGDRWRQVLTVHSLAHSMVLCWHYVVEGLSAPIFNQLHWISGTTTRKMSKVKPTDDRKTPLNDTKATDAELLQVNVDSRPSTTGSNRSVALSTTSDGGDETGIKVVVRMRPMNEREIKLKSKPCVDVNSPLKEVQIKRKDKEDKKFFFDDVFGETSTQTEVFASTGAKVLERFVLGFNVGFQD